MPTQNITTAEQTSPIDSQQPPLPTTEPAKPTSKLPLIIMAVLLVLTTSAAAYFYSQSQKTNTPILVTSATPTPITTASPSPTTNPTADWQTYTSKTHNFSYQCPSDWNLNTNKNYGGKVDVSECSKMYSGQISFDDGIDTNFSFVSNSIANNTIQDGKKWSSILLEQVSNEANAKTYINNGFEGWLSMKNKKYTLNLIARQQTDTGYYEFTATAVGNKLTDHEFKNIVDQILQTFQFIDQTSYQEEIKSMITQYLDAYIAKDWTTVKQFLSSSAINHFNQSIADEYNISSYKIIRVEKSERASNAYTVYVKFYNQNGDTILKLDYAEENNLLVEKENNVYKTTTWYLSP